MTFAPKSAKALALVFASTLALAACGGGAEEADEPAAVATEAAATPAPVDASTADPTPTPSATPSETPSATPSPTPTPSASAAAAVAAKPPEFALCAACHSTEAGKNGIGPSLAGVFGAKAGHVSSFEYSEGMAGSGLTWNQGNLDRYLTDPKAVVPGGKMAYPGLKDAAKRQAMIAYLRSL